MFKDSPAHETLSRIAEGESPEGIEGHTLTALVRAGYVKRTYTITPEGIDALAQAKAPRRKYRKLAEFDTSALAELGGFARSNGSTRGRT